MSTQKKQQKTSLDEKANTEVHSTIHTEASVNWKTLVDKVTIPNIVKGSITLGGGYVGSLLGAGLTTGIGFALGGPAGAAIGYCFGNIAGLGAGVVGGHKFGKYIASQLDTPSENVIETGTTQIDIEHITKADTEKRVNKNESNGQI